MPSKEKYTVLLPTYNERDNIAIVVWLLIRTFTARSIEVLGLQLAHLRPARSKDLADPAVE